MDTFSIGHCQDEVRFHIPERLWKELLIGKKLVKHTQALSDEYVVEISVKKKERK